MKIKFVGSNLVYCREVGYELGNSLVSPGETLDVSDKLATALVESSQDFKIVNEKTKKEDSE